MGKVRKRYKVGPLGPIPPFVPELLVGRTVGLSSGLPIHIKAGPFSRAPSLDERRECEGEFKIRKIFTNEYMKDIRYFECKQTSTRLVSLMIDRLGISES